jgi:hypothetical protein
MNDLNEKLAILSGYSHVYADGKPHCDRHMQWHEPNGEFYGTNPPDYIHSLDLCFRDIKPLLVERGLKKIHFVYLTAHDVECALEFEEFWYKIAETEAVAFCEAAFKFLTQ